MSFYVLKRVLVAVPILFGISLVAFFLIRLIPGDTVTVLLGIHYDEERAENLREMLRLDQSLWRQYWVWATNVLHGDLGSSVFTGRPVLTLIVERLPVTLSLTVLGLLFSVFVGIPLGVLSSVYQKRMADRICQLFGLVGVSIPNFWLGTMLILLFSLSLGWFPSGDIPEFQYDPGGYFWALVLPSLALGTTVSAVVMRMTRSSMLEVMRQDFMKVAQAKGLSGRIVVFKHGLKNAFIPILTTLGIQVGYMLGGSVVVEQVFSLPGLGQLAFQAVQSRDYLLLQGIVLFVGSVFVFVNLFVDILYAFINPMIRYA